MARGVNKVILVGNLGADPETRYTASGAAVTNLSVATNDSWRDRQTGEMQERTEWHRVVLFSKLAEIAGEYLRKGSQVYIEGRLQTRKWQDQSGQDKYTTEVVGNEMRMLDSRGGSAPMDDRGGQRGGSQSGGPSGGQGGGGRGGYGGDQQRRSQPAAPAPSGGMNDDFDDDDIPF